MFEDTMWAGYIYIYIYIYIIYKTNIFVKLLKLNLMPMWLYFLLFIFYFFFLFMRAHWVYLFWFLLLYVYIYLFIYIYTGLQGYVWWHDMTWNYFICLSCILYLYLSYPNIHLQFASSCVHILLHSFIYFISFSVASPVSVRYISDIALQCGTE